MLKSNKFASFFTGETRHKHAVNNNHAFILSLLNTIIKELEKM